MIPTTRIIPTQIPALNISPISSQPVRPTATTESIKINGKNEIFFITSIFLSLIDSYIEVRCKIVPVDRPELQQVGWSTEEVIMPPGIGLEMLCNGALPMLYVLCGL